MSVHQPQRNKPINNVCGTNMNDVIQMTGRNDAQPIPIKGSLKPGPGNAGPVTFSYGGVIDRHYPSEFLPGLNPTFDD